MLKFSFPIFHSVLSFKLRENKKKILTKIIITAPSLWYTFAIVASEVIWIAAFSVLCCARRWFIFFGYTIKLTITRPILWYTAARVTSEINRWQKFNIKISLVRNVEQGKFLENHLNSFSEQLRDSQFCSSSLAGQSLSPKTIKK